MIRFIPASEPEGGDDEFVVQEYSAARSRTQQGSP